ncbi:MAG: hypothetical protein MHM6MM_001299 [Cercozoa sp. M6MM]
MLAAMQTKSTLKAGKFFALWRRYARRQNLATVEALIARRAAKAPPIQLDIRVDKASAQHFAVTGERIRDVKPAPPPATAVATTQK